MPRELKKQDSMKNDETSNNIGNSLDPELELEILDCQDHEEILHPDFVQVNPDDFEHENDADQVKRTIRSIEI